MKARSRGPVENCKQREGWLQRSRPKLQALRPFMPKQRQKIGSYKAAAPLFSAAVPVAKWDSRNPDAETATDKFPSTRAVAPYRTAVAWWWILKGKKKKTKRVLKNIYVQLKEDKYK